MRKIGISRRRLKKEKKKFNRKLILFLKSEEINVTHNKVCFIIVFRIYMRVSRLKKYYEHITIHSNDNLIVEGHHRYIAYKIANKKFTIKAGVKSHHQVAPHKKIKDLIVDYDQDWDKNSSLIKHNDYCKINF